MKNSLDDQEVDPQVEVFAACKAVLQAGRWLMLNGWANMLMLPYIAPSGYWRCAFHPRGRPSHEFYRYSSSSVFRFLENHAGGSVARNIGAERLALAIVKSVPQAVREQCRGQHCPSDLERWLDEVSRQLERGALISAFDENTSDHSRWHLWTNSGPQDETMPPPPGYVPPGEELQWHQTPFWREAIAHARSLDEEEEFLLSFRHVENFDEVARELAIVMSEVGPEVASEALKAAIAKLA